MKTNDLIRRLLGEADEMAPKTAAAPEPAANPPAEAPADGLVDGNTLVSDLASAWRSGSHMDVATRLMFTPVSYATFVKLIFNIGEEDATELAKLLDDLAQDVENEPEASPLVRRATGQTPTAPAEPEIPSPDESEEK